MTDNQFDELFRKKLGDYSSQVPEDMWQRIKQKKNKERRVIILFVLLLLMVGGATSYFVFSGKQQNKENIVSSQKHTRGNNDHALNKKDGAIIMQNDSASVRREHKNLPENNITIKNRNGSDNINYTTPENTKPGLNISSKEKNIKPSNTQRSNESVAKLSEPDLSGEIADSLVNNSSNRITITPNEDISAKQNNQQKLLLQKDSLIKVEQNAKSNKTIHVKSSMINDLYLEVYLSPDIPLSKTSSANTAYLQHKDSTSKMQLSYTIGAKLNALIGNHILAKIGLQYSEINEKFNYTNKNALRTVPVVIQRLLPDATGTMQVVFDTSNLIQTGTQYKLTYNHYRSIDVPVLIGYETGSDRFKAAINTGIILNIKTSYTGDVLDASLNPVDIGSNDIYKSNTGVSLYLGLSLTSKLNNRFHLFTEPYIRYRLSNMTGAYEPFTQKINVGGLSFGLRYNLKK